MLCVSQGSRRYLPCASRVPALSSDQIAARLPLDTVGPSWPVGVGHRRSTIRPPGEEVPVVDALFVWGDVLALVEPRGSEHAGEGRAGGQEALDGDHDESLE